MITPIVRFATLGGRAIDVKDESQYAPGLPNGKLRGVIPYMRGLAEQGATGVVNAGATHSNSHAIAAFAGHSAGLAVVSVVNTSRPTPWTERAREIGAEIVLTRPMHLNPLRAVASRIAAERGYVAIPWGFATAAVVDATAEAVSEVGDTYDAFVVAVGSGGYAAALTNGVVRYGRRARVVGVAAMPRANTEGRIRALLLPESASRLDFVAGATPVTTPFLADPTYEYAAWGYASALADAGERVLFWSVGVPLCE